MGRYSMSPSRIAGSGRPASISGWCARRTGLETPPDGAEARALATLGLSAGLTPPAARLVGHGAKAALGPTPLLAIGLGISLVLGGVTAASFALRTRPSAPPALATSDERRPGVPAAGPCNAADGRTATSTPQAIAEGLEATKGRATPPVKTPHRQAASPATANGSASSSRGHDRPVPRGRDCAARAASDTSAGGRGSGSRLERPGDVPST